MLRQSVPYWLVAALIGAVVAISGYAAIQKNQCAPEPGFSVWTSPLRSEGYILVAPYYGTSQYDKPGDVRLIDKRGGVVHTWKTRYQTLIAYLQPDGHIYAAMTPPINVFDFPSPGSTGIVQELDWDGNVVWEYTDRQMTHDFEIMPDGGVAYIRWHRAPSWFASTVRGGMKPATSTVWTNEIVVVRRDKTISWTWRPEEHLDARMFPLSPLTSVHDWAHANSIRYIADNPLTHTPAFLISVRHISTVFLIDAEKGSVIWQSPKDMFALQHDATLTDRGTILVFDNGLLRPLFIPTLLSRVAEVDPRTNTVTWEYPPGKLSVERAQIASSVMGAAQRLPNGNTLITSSTQNALYEVTPDNQLAWEYKNDFRNEDGQRVMFKAREYDARNTMWRSRLPLVSPKALCGA